MYKQKFSTWQVAPAVLIIDAEINRWLEFRHYEWITEAVIETGLSGLTERGGRTPCNTLQRDIREKPEFFVWANQVEPGQHPRGWLKANECTALKDPNIRDVYDILTLWRDAGMLRLPK